MGSMHDHDDRIDNLSSNPTFDGVLRARLTHRGLLRGGVAAAGASLVGGGLLASCGGDGADGGLVGATFAPWADRLGFTPVDKSLADAVSVPPGYTASVLLRLGDLLAAGVPAYRNDGSEPGASFAQRAGDHHAGRGNRRSGPPDELEARRRQGRRAACAAVLGHDRDHAGRRQANRGLKRIAWRASARLVWVREASIGRRTSSPARTEQRKLAQWRCHAL